MNRFFGVSIAVLGILLGSAAGAAKAPQECLDAKPLTLRGHMVCLSYFMDEAFSQMSDPAKRMVVANDLMRARQQLQMTLGMVPSKLAALGPEQRRLAVLDYQQIQAEALVLIARLEKRILTLPAPTDNPTADHQLGELVLRLQQKIGEGHSKFR